MTFEYRGKSTTKGIKTYRFDVSEKSWKTAEQNPANAPYQQNIYGLINVTAYKSIPSFYSRPNFFGVDESVTGLSTGLYPNNTYYETWSIDIEPESGITMRKRLPGQLSLQVSASSTFYPNVIPGIYPLAWLDDARVLSDKDAKDFKKSVWGARIGANVAFCLGPAIGIIIILAIIYKRKTTYRDASSIRKEKNTVEMKNIGRTAEKKMQPTQSQSKVAIVTPAQEESSGGSSSGSSSDSETSESE